MELSESTRAVAMPRSLTASRGRDAQPTGPFRAAPDPPDRTGPAWSTRAGSAIGEDLLARVPRAHALAALDDPHALPSHLDVGVGGVVGLVRLEHVVLDVDDASHDVEPVPVAGELDVLARPLPPVDVAPADRQP